MKLKYKCQPKQRVRVTYAQNIAPPLFLNYKPKKLKEKENTGKTIFKDWQRG